MSRSSFASAMSFLLFSQANHEEKHEEMSGKRLLRRSTPKKSTRLSTRVRVRILTFIPLSFSSLVDWKPTSSVLLHTK